MSLSEWVMVVNVDIDPAIEKDWDNWYDTVHLPEIVACPGFVRAIRYKAQEPDEDSGRLHQVTVYELDRSDAMNSPEFEAVRGVGPFTEQANAKARLFRQHIVYEKGPSNA